MFLAVAGNVLKFVWRPQIEWQMWMSCFPSDYCFQTVVSVQLAILKTTLCQFFINHISLSILKWNVKVKLERLNYETVNSKTKIKCHLFLCLHPFIHSLNSIRKKVAFMFLSPLAVLVIFTSNTFLHFHSCCQDWWQRFWLKHFLLSVHASIFLKPVLHFWLRWQ